MNRANSAALLSNLSKYVPGGASSNARCGSTIAVERGEGGRLYDVDGNVYWDYILGFGTVLLGHAHPAVTSAVSDALRRGTSFAFSHELEYRVAERIVRHCPSVDRIRLCNSGTDAATTAYRIACAWTGGSKAVKIVGDYHGSVDVLLYDIPGVDQNHPRSRPVAGCKGIGEQATERVITIPFNDAAALRDVLQGRQRNVAAVFMEPIQGNTAAIMPEPGYLEEVRRLCDEHGVVLVFDEVKTGFRVALGGAQALFGVNADLTMYGKGIANGLPLAAIGGRKDLMDSICPGGVHHCGTYFGNLPCCSAADAVLAFLEQADYASFLRRGRRLADGICRLLHEKSIPAHWHGQGSMFGITIGAEKPRDYAGWWTKTDRQLWMRIAAELREQGVLCDGFIGLFFLSFAHTDTEIDDTLDECERAIHAVLR
jgi:glutamate-1-semialdehyde 2,1-aminomutase